MVPFRINKVQVVTQQPSLQTDSDLFMLWVASLCFQESGLLSQLQRPNENQCKPVIWFKFIPRGLPEEMKREVFLEVSLLKTRHFNIGSEVLLTLVFSIHSCVKQELFWLDASMPKTTWPSDTGARSLLALSKKGSWWRWQVAYRCFHENRSYCTKEKIRKG